MRKLFRREIRPRAPVSKHTRRRIRFQWATGLLLALFAPILGCQSNPKSIPTHGTLVGQDVSVGVDSVWAHYYLQNYLNGGPFQEPMDGRIDRALNGLPQGIPDRESLQVLTREFSTDFATLVLANRLSGCERSAILRALYEQELRDIRQQGLAIPPALIPDPQQLVVLFAPGFLYKSIPDTGADFRWHRELLEKQGLKTELIPTLDNTTVERNAQIIAEVLEHHRALGHQVVLYSVSKSGGEVAMALGTLLSAEQTRHVLVWVNIGGILQGTPLADELTEPVPKALLTTFFRRSGWGEFDGVMSMRSDVARARNANVVLPDHLLVINHVGVPLSSQILDRSRRARFFYRWIDEYGPNDGLGLIADALVPGMPTLFDFGSDHFMRMDDREERFLARDRVVLRLAKELAGQPSVQTAGTEAEGRQPVCYQLGDEPACLHDPG